MGLRRVPPSPDVMAMLYMQYKRSGAYKTMSFPEYLKHIGMTNPAIDNPGMDDNVRFRAAARGGPERIERPSRAVTGAVHVKVLLVDFSDRPSRLAKEHYEDILFSDGKYPTGSMRDFYKEVSLGKVKLTGSVHGWYRMPQPYSFYTHGDSGTEKTYPHNAQKLAEDAVNAAVKNGVHFEPKLDKFNDGSITALFIVHSGRGAEVTAPQLAGNEIWSHKWNLKTPIEVAPGLYATGYDMVPFDCKVGVCSHEVGHLVFQWQDFYDPNYNEDGSEWDGCGRWDLMAGGSYNGDGARPAHPAGLHKMQHGWIKTTVVTTSQTLTLKPYSAKYGAIVKVVSPAYKKKQYVLLENRRRTGFDSALPGAGLLVWKVDEAGEQENKSTAGLYLVQADGQKNLDDPADWNEGDAGDPFPGTGKKTQLLDHGPVSTSFKGARSGITLKNIKRDMGTGVMTVDVIFGTPQKTKRKAKTKTRSKRRR